MTSIVVAAHNEELVIGECLSSILRSAEPGEFEIVVVCNACTDRTAAVAGSVDSSITVVETPIGGKPHALNLGDAHATSFPRCYVDADVVMTTDDVRRVARMLQPGQALVAAPRMQVDTRKSSWLVRSYYRVWLRLPWAREDQVGSGFYALSEAAKEHLGPFPETNAEDLWLSAHFPPGQRRAVPEASFTVPASRTIREVVRRKSRIHAANVLLRTQYPDLPGWPSSGGSRALFDLVRRHPRLAPDVAVYGAVGFVAGFRARRKVRTGDTSWDRDARHGGDALDASP